MTVKQAIEELQKIAAAADADVEMLIDCPYCGRGNQISKIGVCVLVAGGKPNA